MRQRIASLLERLVRLREGDFAFTSRRPFRPGSAGKNLSGEMLPYGINPEELMLDLARKVDEHQRDAAAAIEASFAAPEASTRPCSEELPPEEPPPPARRPAGGRRARSPGRGRAPRRGGLRRPCLRTPTPPGGRWSASAPRAAGLLVTDLGLPSESGASFRGGLDLARHASGLPVPPPVLLMAETFDRSSARARRGCGVSLLAFKPGLSKLDPLQYEADLRAFGDKLARTCLPRLRGGRRRGAAPVAAETTAASAATPEPARETVLRSALEEMRRSPDADLIAFLLLRAARAFFPRVSCSW